MRKALVCILLVYNICNESLAAESSVQALTLQQCIDIALEKSAEVKKAEANILEYRARLSEVQAHYYPKLSVLTYAAPMFTVEGDAFQKDVERRFDLGSWGPSTHLEALLAMPIYTFGRIEAGEDAAKARLEVENARLREGQNMVKVEVQKFYYTYLYAKTMLPHLRDADELLDKVEKKANELYDSASGKVTKADLMKIRYGKLEVQKYILMAEEGLDLALGALKHTMGMEASDALQIRAETLPALPRDWALADETVMQQIARDNRPEWEQIEHGQKAASLLRKSNELSNRPIVFVAGSLEADWTPTRDDAVNPYHYDPYNEIFGGVAIGLKLDLDWALRKSKISEAHAKLQQVNAMQKLAVTGIPMQIRKARSNLLRFSSQAQLAHDARKAANKWIVFSLAAYESGTGEVKDVLEGLVALLQSKRSLYESSLQAYIALAELNYALGTDAVSVESH